MKNTILILGATSSISRAAAAIWAQRGYDLFLASKDKHEMARIASDLAIRYDVNVRFAEFHIEKIKHHESFFIQVVQEAGHVAGVLLASGYLGDQLKASADAMEAKKIIDINYTGACSILTHCANYLIKREQGFIAAISSVAGDRGRQSNYFYGSAKGGLSIFLEGLRNRLFTAGVHVLTVKPGFVDTAMTYGRPGMFLVADPKDVAKAIVHAIDKRKNVVYVPFFWRWIMTVICCIPEFIFKRLKL